MNRILRGASQAATTLALMSSGMAMAGTVVGTVSDGSGTRALQRAQLRIVELGRVAEAARDGSFRFPDVPAGTYTIEARYVGADTVRTSITVGATDDTRADIAMGAASGNSIIVVGQLANQASTLSRQRAADGVESVLTRDAIGQFPDQNVAESLRRLPGINILNDQGEGRFVSIRGLDPELNSSSVNGVRLPAPESDVRSVALDVISSDLIESIEVKKSLTPDMDADTIGGSIEIKTTSAFDRKKDLLKISAEGSYNDLTEKVSPKGSIDFSTRLGEGVGVSGGLSYYKRKFATDNMEMDGWDVDGAGNAYADTVEYRDYDVERERISASLSFDFKAGDSTTLYARGLYSQFDDQEYRRRLTFEMDEGPSSSTATTASFLSDDGEISVQRDLKDRFESQKIRSLVLGGETETGPWKATYSASWAKSSERENGSIDPVNFERKFEDPGEFGVTFDYSKPKFTGYAVTAGNNLFLDPGEYEFDKVERTTLSDAQDEEYAVKADISRAFAVDGGTFTVQAGAKQRWRKKTYNATFDIYKGYGAGDLTLADFLGKQDYGLASIDPVLAKTSFRSFFRTNLSDFELDQFDTDAASAESDFRVDEDITSGYLLGRWDSNKVRVIGGVRIERTRNRITGNQLTLVEEGDEYQGVEVDEDSVFVTAQSFKRNYTDILPSLTVRYEPVRNFVLRAAGYKSLVRPKLSKLAPRAVIEDGEGEFGNPALKPYKAWNIDLSVEYYLGRNAAISAGFFYKDIKDYIVDVVSEDVLYNGVLLDEAKTSINGPKAKVKGLELSYSQAFDFLPAPFDGLLTQLNYTYTDAKGTVFTDGDITDPRRIRLPASSKHTFNAVLGYEKGPLSLRAAGTFRDKYLDEVGDDPSSDRYVSKHFQLDLSAKYKITDGIRIFAEWVNVTDEPYFAYQNLNNGRRLLQYEEYSWTAKFGVTAAF
ncbi:TonB-dependent receptor [Sphingomonas sp. Root710]|uniref:TonB-dependent receptor n=1 Tax=Sphingomonas sp. Root710 TaxID=1736594 RepID=UPI0006F8B621|nr:TonB-dependent receptor [Sphingomonas sp. Root710]KRB85890.1 TonB-dependent receptor [Sphingomonas sp. Root710]